MGLFSLSRFLCFWFFQILLFLFHHDFLLDSLNPFLVSTILTTSCEMALSLSVQVGILCLISKLSLGTIFRGPSFQHVRLRTLEFHGSTRTFPSPSSALRLDRLSSMRRPNSSAASSSPSDSWASAHRQRCPFLPPFSYRLIENSRQSSKLVS